MIFKAPEKNAILKSGYGINSIFFQYIHPCSEEWQHRCEQISNIPSHGWRACKNWFFMLTTFFAWGIFSIHQIKKKWSKKGPRPKNFCILKSVMSCLSTKQRNFWSLYCILILFCQSVIWLPLFQFWKKKSQIWDLYNF